MKVLQVIPANLKENNIVYSNFIESEIEALETVGLEIKKLFFLSRKSIIDFLKEKKNLEKQIISFKPDLIHVHTGSTTTFLVALSKKRNIPWIITFGGSELLGNHHSGIKWWMRDTISIFLSKLSARMCNGIICVSKNLQETLPLSCRKKSIVLPRGADIGFYKPIDKTEARKILDLNPDEIIVLFSMNRSNAVVKNKKLAEEVIEYTHVKSGFNIKMITLIGYSKQQIVLLLNAADALIMTSLHEGSPNIVKEAMACNLPIVSVTCGDVEERLKNVRNSYVHSYDSNLLSDSLKKVLVKKERSNGREVLINQGLDSVRITAKIKNYYKYISDK